jgi:hypothetical protein
MIKLTDNIYILGSEITAVTLTKSDNEFVVAVFIRNRQDPFTFHGLELKARDKFNHVMDELDPFGTAACHGESEIR